MKRPLAMVCVLSTLIVLVASSLSAADITATPTDRGVTIKIGDQLFAEYLTKSNTKPIIWPIIGPAGKPMTRTYPMGEAAGEKQDHPHHRSLWFTHGAVNDIDFWAEVSKKNNLGQQRHREFVTVQSGPQALVVTRNDWIGPDGKKVLEDERRIVFGADAQRRWIDFDITLTASEGPLVFGDTKEGSFGVRVNETMKVDAKLGGKIVDSEGRTDKDAWGKTASWVDYQGPVDGQTVALTIMNHPKSFHYPTHWHVRTYGLFAANPFGIKDFDPKQSAVEPFTLPKGQSISLYYRVLLHNGDEVQGRVAEMYLTYARQPKPLIPAAH